MSWAATARRMRTRSSPRCNSSSAIPLSSTSWISSRISSFDMLEKHELLGCRRQDFAAGASHHNSVLDADPAKTLDVSARFNCNRHAGVEFGGVFPADPRRLMNLESQAMAGRVHEGLA